MDFNITKVFLTEIEHNFPGVLELLVTIMVADCSVFVLSRERFGT